MPSKGSYKIYIVVLHPEVFGLYCQTYFDVTYIDVTQIYQFLKI